ncbi:MAG: flavodoxin domain-containing protein [Candidatus Gastranaerophilales bacterium]|nr:flavodoxin domain-containing protein [Candidatus Gastranaerophilales bacterium]
MYIGIIVHSHTGNTLLVAQRLKEKFIEAGHFAKLDRVTAVNEEPSASANVELETAPDISEYDAIIFAAPVRGFSLSPVMKKYLLQLSTLKGKKVGCFVTQFFPYEWMGGKSSIKQMKIICESKEANVYETGIINWSNKQREKKINDLMEKFMI